MDWHCAKEIAGVIKDGATAVGAVVASVYFGAKMLSGYETVDLSISINSERSPVPSDHAPQVICANDYIAVTIKIEKGSRAALKLHNLQIRFRAGSTEIMTSLDDVKRLETSTERAGIVERRQVVWEEFDKADPFLTLALEEKAEFACFTEIPATEPCLVEVAIVGIRRGNTVVAQWRSSHVSLPLKKVPENAA